MRKTEEFMLLGAKPTDVTFQGVVYNNTKIYVEMPLYGGNGIGVIEYSYGTHEDYKQFSDIKLPVPVIIDYEQFTDGRGRTKTVIHSVEVKKSLVSSVKP